MTVFPGSAAATAGLEVGDIILGPPEHPFQEPQQVREWTMRSEINEPAPLVIVRNGQRHNLTLRPGPYPLKMPELPGPPKVGSAAPPLKLEPFRGDTVLAAGKPRLLFFWATWCAPCKASLPEVLAFAQARDVEVVAITDEDTDTLNGFFAVFRHPFPDTAPSTRTVACSRPTAEPHADLRPHRRRRHRAPLSLGYNPQKGLEIDGWTYEARGQKADAAH
jgi:thiol-disulfide isomerase/thioredoxin